MLAGVSKLQFRIVLLLSLVIVMLASVYDLLFPSLDIELVNEFIFELESDSEDYSLLTLVFAAIALGVFVVGYIGLWLFKPWSRPLYIAFYLLTIPFYFVGGLQVSSPVAQLLYDLSVMISGAIFVLIYYSPVKQYFEQANEP